jgi:DNA-binding transcriptional LysR family regulator
MDVRLANTFLEIVNTGSFVRAAERLNISQTAVSARVRALEQHVGHKLFVRNKSGATLTMAGERFRRHAPMLVQVWQRACQDVATPPKQRAVLGIGGELSLWNPLLLNWVRKMRKTTPDVKLKVEVGLAESLSRQVATGVLDAALIYRPQNIPGLRIEQILKEKLVLVTTGGDRHIRESSYVYVDWGQNFAVRHELSFPNLKSRSLHVGLGPLGLSYILQAGGSGYFRLRTVQRYLRSGQLRLIPDAPEFSYPAHAVYQIDADPMLLDPALDALREVAKSEVDEWPIESSPIDAAGERSSRRRRRKH